MENEKPITKEEYDELVNKAGLGAVKVFRMPIVVAAILIGISNLVVSIDKQSIYFFIGGIACLLFAGFWWNRK